MRNDALRVAVAIIATIAGGAGCAPVPRIEVDRGRVLEGESVVLAPGFRTGQ